MSKEIIIFVLGAAVGAGCGYLIGRKNAENKANEEIRRAQEHYKRHYEARLNEDLKVKMLENGENATEKEEKEAKKVERTAKIPNVTPEYEEIVQKTNYNSFSATNMANEDEEIMVKSGPYEVQPGTFDDFIGIDRYELTYFAEDGVVMDSKEVVWNDAIEKIGDEYLDSEVFGRYEPDIIYVINEDYGEGYKIQLDMGSYDDYMSGVEGL